MPSQRLNQSSIVLCCKDLSPSVLYYGFSIKYTGNAGIRVIYYVYVYAHKVHINDISIYVKFVNLFQIDPSMVCVNNFLINVERIDENTYIFYIV